MKAEYLIDPSLTGAKAHVLSDQSIIRDDGTSTWGLMVSEKTKRLMLNPGNSDPRYYFFDNAYDYSTTQINCAHKNVFNTHTSILENIRGLPLIIYKGLANDVKDLWQNSNKKIQVFLQDKKIYDLYRDERFESGSIGDDISSYGNWFNGPSNNETSEAHAKIFEELDGTRCVKFYDHDSNGLVDKVIQLAAASGANDDRWVTMVIDFQSDDTDAFVCYIGDTIGGTVAAFIVLEGNDLKYFPRGLGASYNIKWASGGVDVNPQGLHVYWFKMNMAADTFECWVDGKQCYFTYDATVTAPTYQAACNTVNGIDFTTGFLSGTSNNLTCKIYGIQNSWKTPNLHYDFSALNTIYIGCLDDRDIYHFGFATAPTGVQIQTRQISSILASKRNITGTSWGSNTTYLAWERIISCCFGELFFQTPNPEILMTDDEICDEFKFFWHSPGYYTNRGTDMHISPDGWISKSQIGSVQGGIYQGKHWFMLPTNSIVFVGYGGAFVDDTDKILAINKSDDAFFQVSKVLDDKSFATVQIKNEFDIDIETNIMQLIDNLSSNRKTWDFEDFAENQDIADNPRVTDNGNTPFTIINTELVISVTTGNTGDIDIDTGLFRAFGSFIFYFTYDLSGGSYFSFILKEYSGGLLGNVTTQLNLQTGELLIQATSVGTIGPTLYHKLELEFNTSSQLRAIIDDGTPSAWVAFNVAMTNGLNQLQLQTNVNVNMTVKFEYIDYSFESDKKYRIFCGDVKEKRLDLKNQWNFYKLEGAEAPWFTQPSDRDYGFTYSNLIDNATNGSAGNIRYPGCRFAQTLTNTTIYTSDIYNRLLSSVLSTFADILDRFFWIINNGLIALNLTNLEATLHVTGVESWGRNYRRFQSVIVIGNYTDAGQIKVTRSNSIGIGEVIIYRPEIRTITEAQNVGDAFLNSASYEVCTIIQKRHHDEYIGRICKVSDPNPIYDLDDDSFFCIREEEMGNGTVKLTLSEIWIQDGGRIGIDNANRAQSYSSVDASKADAGSSGSRSTVKNWLNGMFEGFFNVFPSPSAPTNPTNGMLWFDTSVNKLKCYYSGSWYTW